MKYFLMTGGAAALLMLGTGCGGVSTEIFDPAADKTGIRQTGSVSSEEMRQAALAAAQDAMASPRFAAFLAQYRKEMRDPNAVPILKLDMAFNETDDPDLKVAEITDAINEVLLNAGKVEVTMAEGASGSRTIGDSRLLEQDANFDQRTVAKRHTLQAARLLLRPKIISNTVRSGKKTVVVRTFVMDMADIHTGKIIWKYSKQLGFVQTQSTFGW